MDTYKIKKGDTLYRIANQYGTTVDELARINNIGNPDLIHYGEQLNLPEIEAQMLQTPAHKEFWPRHPVQPTTDQLLSEHESNTPTYQQSQELEEALQNLSDYGENKPGEYESQYSGQISGMLDDILNREDFSYSFDADPMYQQYKNQYQQMGERAMADTMGSAAQLSGGYGNSYAQTAGQQQYNQHMQQLNNVIPALRDAAYSMYQAEGNEMKNQLSVLEGMDEKEYGLYRDEVADYNQEYNRLYNEAQNMSNEEYTKYLNDYRAWESERNYLYGKSQDELAQRNRDQEWDYMMAQDEKKSAPRRPDGPPPEPETNDDKKFKELLGDLERGDLTHGSINGAIANGFINEEEARILRRELKLRLASGDDNGKNNKPTDAEKAGLYPFYTGVHNGKYYINGKRQIVY